VLVAALVAALLTLGAIAYRKKVSRENEDRLVPEEKLGLRNLFELIIETALGLAEGVMGREKAERYFPLVGTLVFFILFNNLIGLVPGFLPATDTLKTNAALSITVFVMTHVYGFKAHGPAYVKHFLGPVWYLAPLMFVIEIISHIARPVSLALRLMGNIAADHKVVAAFFVLIPILVPLPFLVLGILVSIVQTLVFSLLTMVYIDLAVAHEEHG
jgi:F-type H+-transporting ATPase subunit a